MSLGEPRPQYKSLNSTVPEIRLLLLLPSENFNTPIECRLIHRPLNHGSEYEALSYTWGRPEFTQYISLDL
jgi:hypothetical protein